MIIIIIMMTSIMLMIMIVAAAAAAAAAMISLCMAAYPGDAAAVAAGCFGHMFRQFMMVV